MDASAVVGQSVVYNRGGGERATGQREVWVALGRGFFFPRANNKRLVGEKHKYEGLVVRKCTASN